MDKASKTHSELVGFILLLFGFTGAHRFYYGRPYTGVLWACTGGLFLIGWFVDFFLNRGMAIEANRRFRAGEYDDTIAWLLLFVVGWLGLHRFYMGKWITGVIFLCSGGLVGLGILHDLCNLNEQVTRLNERIGR